MCESHYFRKHVEITAGFKRPDVLTSCHLAARVLAGAKQRATWPEKIEQVRRKVSRLGTGVGRSNQIARPTRSPSEAISQITGRRLPQGRSLATSTTDGSAWLHV